MTVYIHRLLVYVAGLLVQRLALWTLLLNAQGSNPGLDMDVGWGSEPTLSHKSRALHADASSPRKCPPTNECYPCAQVECDCGSYKDECGCCDRCYKCRGAPCSVLASEACETGYTCGDPTRDYIQKIHSNTDICEPEASH